ncbi:hypothetical protein KZ810_07980 [Sphingomonas sp. RHCKR47]|uniref:DUF7697 family protein n=1 Tax=Sphingomonas citricola TaxID=2862498 RepID=UPI001CA52D3F|nr:hypothetical protein [Sphingomonas citricola]MBW6523435.1 hypothetical protein [Sphingomonas citricola]
MAQFGPFALDFGAIMQVGAARGVDLDLLSQALPHVEAAIISNLTDQAPSDQEGGDGGS